MEEAKDIVGISVPFAAGILLSASFPWHFAIAAAALPLAALLMYAGKRARSSVPFLLLFLLLGAFCHSSSMVAGHSDRLYFQKWLSAFSGMIDSLPFPHQGTRALVRALLTGRRDMLARETVQVFRDAGASHILALSGLHLGIICLLAGSALSILGRSRTASVLRSGFLILFAAAYTLMTGASPSTVRALLFTSIAEAARHSPGRKASPASVWCTALLVQLVLRPDSISSTGFRLSYLAMLGIFVLFPRLEAWYPSGGRSGRFDPFRRIWSAVALSCSCQAFTAPLVWFTFHTFPKHFILTNLLALPLTELLMACSIGALAASALQASTLGSMLTGAADAISCKLLWCLQTIAGM
ncbi:MAG: ComEC/Rec2 family competence protein [Bacteroidales bacterium]|nr:ComEC/Rec2 family competence protein [Bacteroidales bacterium]